jgi:hypothetical protein
LESCQLVATLHAELFVAKIGQALSPSKQAAVYIEPNQRSVEELLRFGAYPQDVLAVFGDHLESIRASLPWKLRSKYVQSKSFARPAAVIRMVRYAGSYGENRKPNHNIYRADLSTI